MQKHISEVVLCDQAFLRVSFYNNQYFIFFFERHFLYFFFNWYIIFCRAIANFPISKKVLIKQASPLEVTCWRGYFSQNGENLRENYKNQNFWDKILGQTQVGAEGASQPFGYWVGNQIHPLPPKHTLEEPLQVIILKSCFKVNCFQVSIGIDWSRRGTIQFMRGVIQPVRM